MAAHARALPSGLTGSIGAVERTVVIEFEGVEAAVAAYESPAYQRALEALGDGAVRDLRIIEGLRRRRARPDRQ